MSFFLWWKKNRKNVLRVSVLLYLFDDSSSHPRKQLNSHERMATEDSRYPIRRLHILHFSYVTVFFAQQHQQKLTVLCCWRNSFFSASWADMSWAEIEVESASGDVFFTMATRVCILIFPTSQMWSSSQVKSSETDDDALISLLFMWIFIDLLPRRPIRSPHKLTALARTVVCLPYSIFSSSPLALLLWGRGGVNI